MWRWGLAVLGVLVAGGVWWVGHPDVIVYVPNGAGTAVARVDSYERVSFGDSPYAVVLEASPGGWPHRETRVAYLINAGYGSKSGPRVTWENPTTLVVQADSGRTIWEQDTPRPRQYPVTVKRDGRDIAITVKLLTPP